MNTDTTPSRESRDPQFLWEQLQKLEDRHRSLQSECHMARRGLDQAGGHELHSVREAWNHYCEVIAELDQTTAQIEVLRVNIR